MIVSRFSERSDQPEEGGHHGVPDQAVRTAAAEDESIPIATHRTTPAILVQARLTQTPLVSVNSSIAFELISRPQPLAPNPPHGAAGSR